MNIESKQINLTQEVSPQKQNTVSKENDGKFAEELKNVKKDSETKDTKDTKETKESEKTVAEKEKETKTKEDTNAVVQESADKENLNKAIEGLKNVVKEVNQSEEKTLDGIKYKGKLADNSEEGEILINNDFNIQENKEIMPQMNPNMNFGGDGQPFSSFMNNNPEKSQDKLSSSSKELAEEAAILSTMAENIAMANRANIETPDEKIVDRNDGIKKVDTHSGITKETIVKYDSVIMNKSDVEVFANLVQNGEVNLDGTDSESIQKSMQVSKTLSDLLAKAMQDNKPVRIDFDNNISVIIKISKDGKITADFLPSSQVAEAYLKENLPLLKQRFDEQNIEYDELNQRERRNKEQENNRKKGRENE